MAEELDEEQLLAFCQRLGLAENGYLDEKDLSIVCNCIGLNAPAEMMKELFQDLDGDGDGKVCLAELGQMLRGMQSKTLSPPKHRNSFSTEAAASSGSLNRSVSDRESEFCTLPVTDRAAFAILDPEHTGFAKTGSILDLWSQLGISHESGTLVLKEMGFPTSRTHSINLQDFARCIENETDQCKEIGLPPVIHIALATYRTEAQYLRSVCESMECEREKLKSDIFDAHRRSEMLAQEVDEQNNRVERNTQVLLHKTETKYLEQIHELQKRFSAEKDYLQNSVKVLESQLTAYKEEEISLRSQITGLNEQNSRLENEKLSHSEEVETMTRLKQQLEKEHSRYTELESKLQELEKTYTEKTSYNGLQLERAYSEIQSLQDQNDELSSQVQEMKDALNKMKATHGKRCYVKRRKESATRPLSLPFIDGENCSDEFNDFPMQKIGKYNLQSLQTNPFFPHEIDQEDFEGESSMEHINGIPSASPPDSGNFPSNTVISLAACMGESSTDSQNLFSEGPRNTEDEFVRDSEPNFSKVEKLEKQYKTLENEMDSVKEKIVTILSEKEKLITENSALRSQLEATISQDKPSPYRNMVDIDVQTTDEIDPRKSSGDPNIQTGPGNSRMEDLEKELELCKTKFNNEKQELQNKCSNLESSLELLQIEYEKCEDYWHGKLQKERDIYDQLAMKIKEYEELLVLQAESDSDIDSKLSPIEERGSLEQQVNEYMEEVVDLKNELVSLKTERMAEIENYQRKWESKTLECSILEEQLNAVTKKCHDYESRLSALAEEERTNVEDTSIVEILKDRVSQLEASLNEKDDKHRQHVKHLDKSWREREQNFKKSIAEVNRIPVPQTPKSAEGTTAASPLLTNPAPSECSKMLLDILHQPPQTSSESLWARNEFSDRSASLPFIPNIDMTNHLSGWGNTSPSISQDIWSPQSQTQHRKAWCHVELGWLQALRCKLKQREEQCYGLQLALSHREVQAEKQLMDLKYQHAVERSTLECLVHTQAEKLAHADLLLKDLWVENAKLMSALNATELRVIQLEKLLKIQISTTGTSSGSLSAINNILSTNTNAAVPTSSSQLSLPHSYSYFSS